MLTMILAIAIQQTPLPPRILLNGSDETTVDWNPTASETITVKAGGRYEYRSINIPANVTITFLRNSTNDPVMLLARDSVSIAGTIIVRGYDSGEAGPGGFDGGSPGQGIGIGGAGHGPGGGINDGTSSNYHRGAASHATRNSMNLGPLEYGRSSSMPLIGGSGGSGSSTFLTGGGGGGAILIGADNAINITGKVNANGGSHQFDGQHSGAGSGGTIRLVARDVTVVHDSSSPRLTAQGGSSNYGGYGFIRIDSITRSIWMDASVSTPLPSLASNLIVELDSMPHVELVSVAGVLANGVSKTITLSTTDPSTQPVVVDVAGPMACAEVTIRVVPDRGAPTTTTVNWETADGSEITRDVTIPPNLPTTIEAYAKPLACAQ